jgi:metal-responsive CopG/Arc/MetJ family transcriptional regulator
MRMSVRTNLMLPKELVDEVDRVAGPRERSRWVAEAIEARLRRERLRRALDGAAGAWSGVGPPEWGRPNGVVEWVRGLRAEETDPGPG